MQDKTLLKIAMITAIAGISLLFILCNELSVDSSTLSKITSADSAVSVKGSVLKVINSTNSRIVQIEKKERLDIIVVGQDYLDIAKGDSVEVIGDWSNRIPGNLSMMAQEMRKI